MSETPPTSPPSTSPEEQSTISSDLSKVLYPLHAEKMFGRFRKTMETEFEQSDSSSPQD